MPGGKLSQEEFYKKYYPIVKDSVKGTGLFPETVIAQMAIESGWGGSGLTTKYNNYFGIKGGKGVPMETEEEKGGKRVSITDKFRVYNSVEDSIKDYVRLLTTNDKYKEVLKAKSPEEQAELIGNSPYSTSSTYGSSIKNTIKSNQDKTKTMATNDKDNSLEEYKKLQDKLELEKYRYEQGKGTWTFEENKRLYSKLEKTQKELDNFKVKMVSDYQSKEDQKYRDANKILDEKIKEAESSGNYKEAKKLELQKTIVKERKEKFDKDKVDFTRSTEKNISKEELNKRPGAFTKGEEYSVPNIDLDKVSKTFDNLFSEKLKEVPTEESVETEKPIVTNDTTGGGSGTSQTTTTNVRDYDPNGTAGNGKDMTLTPQESKTEVENIDKELEAYRDIEQYNFQPTDSYQNETDLLGTAMDIGRGVVGMIGATKEVPKYQRGSMFSSAMNRADARKDMGLSPEEMAFRERQGEEAYAYDIKNISRAAGGNAGAYLGNVGSAVQRLYGNKSAMAAENEAVKRANNQNFQGMALQDEQINRQIFLDDLNLTMMEKQAGAGLVQDAMGNIQNRLDYNRQYGNNSIYGKYMNAQTNAMNQATYDLGFRARNNPLFKKNELELRKQKLLQEQQNKADESSIGTNVNEEIKIKQPGLVTRTVTDVPVTTDSEFNSVNAKDEADALLIESSKKRNKEKLSMQDEKIKDINENPETVLEDTDKELEEYFKRKPKTKTRRRLITSNK